MTEQSEFSKLYEGILEAMRAKIEELATGEDKIIERVIEGEEEMGESSSVCLLVGGPDDIVVSGARNLEHRVTVWASYMSKDLNEKGALKRLRNIAGLGYDKIMEDVTLGGEVLICFPRRVEPGFIVYGEQVYVGVLQTWEVRKRAPLTVPYNQG